MADIDELNDVLNKAEDIYKKNERPIFIVLGIVIVAVLAYYGYNYYKNSKEADSLGAEWQAVRNFESDSLDLALDGNLLTNSNGFLYVAEEHSGTKVGKRAAYYAGLTYMKKKDFQSAIDMLKGLEFDDPYINVVANGALADCYVETNQSDQAIAHYKKALTIESDLINPVYLYKLGLLYKEVNNNEEAIACFEQIRDHFPNSSYAIDAQKLIPLLSSK